MNWVVFGELPVIRKRASRNSCWSEQSVVAPPDTAGRETVELFRYMLTALILWISGHPIFRFPDSRQVLNSIIPVWS